MTIETTTFVLPDFWASALVNDDRSGLDIEDDAILDRWLEDHPGWYCTGTVDDSDADFVRWHDAAPYGVLHCNCLTYTFAHS